MTDDHATAMNYSNFTRTIIRNDGLTYMFLLIMSAWLVLLIGHGQLTGLSPFSSHYFSRTSEHSLIPLFLGWELMLIAMMLPTTIPICSLFSRMTSARPHRSTLQILLIFGYLTPWSLTGIAFILVYEYASSILTLETYSLRLLVEPTVLVAAGLYQFSPFKYTCLKHCRSRLGMIMRYWQGRQERMQAYRLGVGHGLVCLGCCWLLMLTMSMLGIHHIGWMLLIGTAMALEKFVAHGKMIQKPLGIVLIMWGVILFANGGYNQYF